jgi:exopolysaccharide biosynthesis WecB/TagA/CpsF family protein
MAVTNVLGVRVYRTTYDEAVRQILDAARKRRSFAVTALAVHGLMSGVSNKEFGARLNQFDLVTPDGQPLRWSLNWLGSPKLADRVYGPTLTLRVCEASVKQRIGIYLFGSTPAVVQKMATNLESRFPKINIAGIQPDRFRNATPHEDLEDIERINSSGAGIVLVGRGCPRQEDWIYEHIGRVNAAMLAVGAAFDFIAGTLPQAPPLMQKYGFEWLFRLAAEPRRLWKRYLVTNSSFLYNISLQLMHLKRFPYYE